MYCQSTFFPVWGCYFFFVFHCTVRVPSFLSEDVTFSLYSTAASLLMYLPSHINHCCQMSPNVLSKHHQSVWGSYTCLLLVFGLSSVILHLSRWAAVAGLQVLRVLLVLSGYLPSCLRMSFSFVFHCCEVFPNVLSKHHQSVSWNYTCLLLVQVSPNVLSEYQQFWGSHVNSGCQVFS